VKILFQNIISYYFYVGIATYQKNGFAEVSKNLVRYRFEINYVGSSK